MTDQPHFTCPDCGATSYNPNDIREGYCGRCHRWTGVASAEERDILKRLGER
jgi:hypothetical protein